MCLESIQEHDEMATVEHIYMEWFGTLSSFFSNDAMAHALQTWVHAERDPHVSITAPVVVLTNLPTLDSTPLINSKWMKDNVRSLADATGISPDRLFDEGYVQYMDRCSHVPRCHGRCCMEAVRCGNLLQGIREGRVRKVVRLGAKKYWNKKMQSVVGEGLQNVFVERERDRKCLVNSRVLGEDAFQSVVGVVAAHAQ
jgi:hypothetical protein